MVELSLAKSFRDALMICIKQSHVKRTNNELALLCGINPSQFHKCIYGDFHLPLAKIPVIENACGNTAITQWLALQHDATIEFEGPEKVIAELRAQLAKVAA